MGLQKKTLPDNTLPLLQSALHCIRTRLFSAIFQFSVRYIWVPQSESTKLSLPDNTLRPPQRAYAMHVAKSAHGYFLSNLRVYLVSPECVVCKRDAA